ncbi:MAG TPA: hypothetical protein VML35_07890 [Gaiellaceae bacterium]|nr:hypothetical protein [Gaiellaceae bacterium]
MSSDAQIGEELRQFFLRLIQDGEALQQYNDPEQRAGLIQSQHFAYSETQELLLKGTLAQIEEKIRAVTSNPSGAMPMLIVWPPM